MESEEKKKYIPVPVYCPKCGRKVHTHDGRGTLYIHVKCKKCNKLVVYKPEEKETLLRPLPEKVSSAGYRFY